MLGEWHDGLPYPTKEGQPGGVFGLDSQFQSHPYFFFFDFSLFLKYPLICILLMMFFYPS